MLVDATSTRSSSVSRKVAAQRGKAYQMSWHCCVKQSYLLQLKNIFSIKKDRCQVNHPDKDASRADYLYKSWLLAPCPWKEWVQYAYLGFSAMNGVTQ